MSDENTSTNLTTVDNNVRRLVAEIKNLSHNTKFTAARLLGALRAVNAVSPETAIAAGKIGWEPHSVQKVVDALATRGLVKWKSTQTLHFANREPTTKRMGLHLTDLGLLVAKTGEFYDILPAEDRWIPPGQRKNNSPMIKNSKKRPAIAPTGSGQIALTPELQQLIAAVIAQNPGSFTAANVPASGAATPTSLPSATLSEYETISIVLGRVVPQIVAALHDLVDQNAGKKKVDRINVKGLYVALTELMQTVTGLKCYVSECLKAGEDVDLDLFDKYAADFEEAIRNLSKKKNVPLMGTRLWTKRFKAGEMAIRRTPWKRPAKART